MVVLIFWMNHKCRVDPYLDPDMYSYFDMNEFEIAFTMDLYKISDNTVLLILSDPHPAMLGLDLFCMLVFILEAIVHFIACPWKRKYFQSAYNLLKIVLSVAMVTSLGLDMNKALIDTQWEGNIYLTLRSISALRILLIFRLHKLYVSLDLLLLSLRSSLKELLLLAFGFFICVIVYGATMFSAQLETGEFPTIWTAMWWAVITMTTVGYGDFFPTTTLGYLIGIACAINGLVILAIPVAAIANNFASFYSKHADLQKHNDAICKQEEKPEEGTIKNHKDVKVQDI